MISNNAEQVADVQRVNQNEARDAGRAWTIPTRDLIPMDVRDRLLARFGVDFHSDELRASIDADVRKMLRSATFA